MSERLKPEPVTRRDFLGLAGLWAAGIAVVGSLLGMVKLLKPSVTPETAASFRIGYPAELNEGVVKLIPAKKVRIESTRRGIVAMSMICTHLGCIVKENDDGFNCPCHGSKFDLQGNVLAGPAPRGLRWFDITQAADGNLVVNTGKEVPPGTFYLA